MIVKGFNIGGEYVDIEVIVGNEFAEAFQKYNFKDMDEFNKLYFAQDRCTAKGLYSWCPAEKFMRIRLLLISRF